MTLKISPFLVLLALASCSSEYYTEEDFSSVKKFDTHIHLRTTSDAVSKLATQDNFQLLNVVVATGEFPIAEQEQYALQQVSAHPKQIEYLTAFGLEKWDSTSWANETIEQLRKSFSNGAHGIKIWKNIGMVDRDAAGKLIMIDDPRFDPVIQFVIDQKKTVMGHLGEPRNCWLPLEQMTVNNDRSYFKNHPEYHMFLHPEFPSYEDQVNARDRFLERHPDMKFVGAHLGSLEYDVDSLAKRLDRFPNMAVDMAARIGHLQYQSQRNYDKVRQFMIKYQDRLIYGSDSGMEPNDNAEGVTKNLHKRWVDDWKYFATDKEMSVDEVEGSFKGLRLPKEVIDKIYFKNAINWFGIKS